MARLTTLAGMKNYILSVLGNPVIQVEVADEQLDRIITDTIQIFTKYNTGEGNYEDFMRFTVSAGVSAYSTVGMNLASVVDIDLSFASRDGINVLFSSQNQLLFEDWVVRGGPLNNNGQGMILSEYEVAMEYLNDVHNMFSIMYHAQYSDARQEILIFPTPVTAGTGLLNVYKRNSAEDLYNDNLVKQYAVAEAKIQWGSNLSKYDATLPDGTRLNGDKILEEGKAEKEKALLDIVGESEPPPFFMA